MNADVRFYGDGPFLCVDVRFSTRKALDQLIDGLTTLRRQNARESDHIHLQHPAVSRHRPFAGAEVVFFRPRKRRNSIDKQCVLEAHTALQRMAHGGARVARQDARS